MSSTAIIHLLELISKIVPKDSINRLVISPHSRKIIQIYDLLPKPKAPKIYQIANDVSIEVNLSNPGERAISFNAFEPIVTKRFLEIVKDRDVVIDLGAWIGYYTLLAARHVGLEGSVISIEPHRINFERIKSNIHLNGFQNVKLLNLAVGDEQGTKTLMEGNDSLTHTIMEDRTGYQINTDTVDNIVSGLRLDTINLIIMDIEGYEYFALRGAKNALTKGIIKNMICEIHPDKLRLNGYSDSHVLDLLSKFGYKIDKFTNFQTCYHIQASI